MRTLILSATALVALVPSVASAQCELYYKFDRGVGTAAANYGTAVVDSQIVSGVGSTPWQAAGQNGGALGGSSNSSATDFVYCDTGWKSAITGSFTVSWWSKQRAAPGTGLSYVFSGIGSFRCFTNGVAGTELWVRNWGGADLKMPTVGGTFQTRAAAAGGVSVALVVDGPNLSAQWYVDGAPHGAAITLLSPANVVLGTNFLIGKHTSDTSSFAYDVDEFRFCNRAASAAEIKAWHLLAHAGNGTVGKECGIKLGANEAPVAGSATYTVEASAPANTRYLFVAGAKTQPGFDMGLVFGGLAGCTWYTEFLIQVAGSTASGKISIAAPIPANAAGSFLDTQILGFDPTGKPLMSNAMVIKVEKQ